MKRILFFVYKCLAGIPAAYNLFYKKDNNGIHHSLEYSKMCISGDIKVGEGCKIVNGVLISAQNRVTVGKYTSINGPSTFIYARHNPVSIGSFTSIARGVDIQEFNHRTKHPTSYYVLKNYFGDKVIETESKGPVVIGNDVWIGAKSTILSGVTIGDGAIIAANSVVTTDIPPYAIAGGVPAKVIGKRFEDHVVEKLLDLKWWNWDSTRMALNKSFFEKEITSETLQSIK